MSRHRAYDAVRGGYVPTTQATSHEAQSEPNDVVDVASEVWKDLIRYVLLNARDLSVCCALFGKAAMVVRPARYRCLISKSEHAAMAALLTAQWRAKSRAAWGTGMRLIIDDAVDALRGHTPLSLLLMGEAERYVHDVAMQRRRAEALDAIFMAAWRDVSSGVYAQSLGEAFRSFVVLAAQDTSLMAWVNQTELARAFAQTRAAICARTKRMVKARLQTGGMVGITPIGGKSEAAVQAYAAVQRGNECRASASWDDDKKREHEEARRSLRAEHGDIPIRPELPKNPVALRAHLRAMEEAADRRRLGLE